MAIIKLDFYLMAAIFNVCKKGSNSGDTAFVLFDTTKIDAFQRKFLRQIVRTRKIKTHAYTKSATQQSGPYK